MNDSQPHDRSRAAAERRGTRLFRTFPALGLFVSSGTVFLGLAGGGLVEILDVINNFLPLLTVSIFLFGILSIVVSRGHLCLLTSAVIIIALSSAAIRLSPEYDPRAATAAEPGVSDLKVLTHNVSVHNRDVGLTEARLLSSGADVLVLQETDGTFAGSGAAIAAVYPHSNTCRSRCSLRIFSKRPILRNRYRLRDADGQQIGPPLIWAETTAPDGTSITIVSLHYTWPVPIGEQRRQRESLAQVLAGRDDIIVAGDMNLTPWTAAMHRQDEAWQPLRRVTRAAWSWPSRVGGFDIAFPVLPIDHIYASPGWRPVGMETLEATGSDHYPLMATFRRAATR